MQDANRPDRVVPNAGTCCIALALGLGTVAFGGGPTTARAQGVEGTASADTERTSSEKHRRWWITDQWIVGGDAIAWKHGWMYVDSAVAIRDGGATEEHAWRLRARRLALRVAPTSPRRIVALRARGRVRLVGPPPLYVAGRRAVSFRPGRSLTVWASASSRSDADARTATPRLVGEGWTLTGRTISIDLLADRATVDEVTASRSSEASGAGRAASTGASH